MLDGGRREPLHARLPRRPRGEEPQFDALGVHRVCNDAREAPRAPGSDRRELLDHVLIRGRRRVSEGRAGRRLRPPPELGRVISAQLAAVRAEALCGQQLGLRRERRECERERVRRLPGGVEPRFEIDRVRGHAGGDVAGERGEVLHGLRRRGTEAVTERAPIDRRRRGLRVTGRECFVMQRRPPRPRTGSPPGGTPPGSRERAPAARGRRRRRARARRSGPDPARSTRSYP